MTDPARPGLIAATAFLVAFWAGMLAGASFLATPVVGMALQQFLEVFDSVPLYEIVSNSV